MSQLKLTADSGGGTVAIKAPASTTGNAALDLTVPGTASDTLDTLKRAGNILQVVSTNVDSTSSISMSTRYSYYELTPLTTNITTTAANSKILVSAGIGGECDDTDHSTQLRFGRVIGGSLSYIFKGADASNRLACLSIHQQGYHASDQSSTPSYNSFPNMLDSPSQAAGTTITYKFFVSSAEGASATYYLNRSVTDTDNTSYERLFSYLTLMEVAA